MKSIVTVYLYPSSGIIKVERGRYEVGKICTSETGKARHCCLTLVHKRQGEETQDIYKVDLRTILVSIWTGYNGVFMRVCKIAKSDY